jgi:hypothetical protein
VLWDNKSKTGSKKKKKKKTRKKNERANRNKRSFKQKKVRGGKTVDAKGTVKENGCHPDDTSGAGLSFVAFLFVRPDTCHYS